MNTGRLFPVRRSIAACAAAVAVAFLIARVWAFLSARPSFYADAWSDAESVLENVVGRDAVANGAFSVPRVKLPIGGGSTGRLVIETREPVTGFLQKEETLHVIVAGGDSAVAVLSCEARPDTDLMTRRLRLARVPAARAKRVLAALTYIAGVYEDTVWWQPWLSGGTAVDGAGGIVCDDSAAATLLHLYCAGRYVRALLEDGTLDFTEDPDTIRRWACGCLKSRVRPRTHGDHAIATLALECLQVSPDPSVQPLLSKAAPRQRGPIWHWLALIPLVGGFFSSMDTTPFALDPTDCFWAAGNLKGSNEDERFASAFGAFLPALDIRSVRAWEFMERRWPYRKPRRRSIDIRTFVYFPMYQAFARQTGGRVPASVRPERAALLQAFYVDYCLFLRTGDKASLDRCVKTIAGGYKRLPPVRHGNAGNEWCWAAEDLAALYLADPRREEIGSMLRTTFFSLPMLRDAAKGRPPLQDSFARTLGCLLAVGGHENRAVLSEAVRLAAEEPDTPAGAAACAALAGMRPDAFDLSDAAFTAKLLNIVDITCDDDLIRTLLSALMSSPDPQVLASLDAVMSRRIAALALEPMPHGLPGPDSPLPTFSRFHAVLPAIADAAAAKDPAPLVKAANAEPWAARQVLPFILARFPVSRLQSLLANHSCEPLQEEICLAIISRRQAEEGLAPWE